MRGLWVVGGVVLIGAMAGAYGTALTWSHASNLATVPSASIGVRSSQTVTSTNIATADPPTQTVTETSVITKSDREPGKASVEAGPDAVSVQAETAGGSVSVRVDQSAVAITNRAGDNSFSAVVGPAGITINGQAFTAGRPEAGDSEVVQVRQVNQISRR